MCGCRITDIEASITVSKFPANSITGAIYDSAEILLQSRTAGSNLVIKRKGVPERRHQVLILSRKVGQRICIGEKIEILIVEISENQVRVGVEAPRAVPVYRKELLEQTTDSSQAPEQ